MKKIILSIATFFTLGLFAFGQAPQKMQYQAVARDNSGAIIANQAVNFKISIVSGSANGTVEYSETHNANTNNFGLVNLQIGSGTVVSGTIAAIDWGSSTHYVKIEMDATGGNNYQLMGTSQLLSVPYALHSKTAENTFSGDYNDLINQPTLLTSPNDADADPTNEIQTLTISGSDLTLSNGGGTISLPTGGGSNGIIEIDNTNYTSVTTANDDVINIKGIINITANYTKLDIDGAHISGGKFIGTGTEEIEFGRNTTIIGVQFENLTLDASDETVFINCSFTNVSTFGFDAIFESCQFSNCSDPTGRIGHFSNCEIQNSTFKRVNFIDNCQIRDCILGGDYNASPNEFRIYNITNCEIDDSKIYVKGNFSNNRTDGLTLYAYPWSSLAITGNYFDDAYTGLDQHIIIDMNGSAITNLNISNNVFDDSNANAYINVLGSFTGSYNLIKISNNSFIRGTAINNTSININLVVTNNSSKSGSLGVSNGGNTIVRDNDSF